MIKHIAMWKLAEYAEGSNRSENAQKMKSLLEGLGSKIDEIKHIEVGINIDRSVGAFDILLYSEFENAEDLEAYQKHPEHVKVAEFVGKVRFERKAVDYEV